MAGEYFNLYQVDPLAARISHVQVRQLVSAKNSIWLLYK